MKVAGVGGAAAEEGCKLCSVVAKEQKALRRHRQKLVALARLVMDRRVQMEEEQMVLSDY
jgi:hypothetical protein